MLKQKLIGFIIALILATPLFADCPRPNKLIKSCAKPTECNWLAIGWEGFTAEGADHGDTKISRFLYTYWWNYHQGSPDGTVQCIYAGDKGSIISVGQSADFGAVPKPKVSVWTPFKFKSRDALMCTTDISACQFAYG